MQLLNVHVICIRNIPLLIDMSTISTNEIINSNDSLMTKLIPPQSVSQKDKER